MDEGMAPWVTTDEMDPTANESWRVDGLGSAEWAMAHLVTAERTLAQLEAQYTTWKAQLDSWLKDASGPALRTVEFFGGHLERYALAQREATGAATLKLPSGKVATRKSAESVQVVDEGAVLRFAAQTQVPDGLGELVPMEDLVTKRKLSLTALRANLKVVHVEAPGGWWEFPCGHFLDTQTDGAPDVCPSCGAPVEFGTASWHQNMETTVTTLTGDEIPGVELVPERITAKAQPNTAPALADHVQGVLGSIPTGS